MVDCEELLISRFYHLGIPHRIALSNSLIILNVCYILHRLSGKLLELESKKRQRSLREK